MTRELLLWLRGAIFTLLVPSVVAGVVPQGMLRGASPQSGWWRSGWLVLTGGFALYVSCLWQFLAAKGTPAIFFTRPLRFLWGEEPPGLVRTGPYLLSRNPMYFSVVLLIFGQAVLYASRSVAIYCVLAFVCFHLVVTLIEEPHLRARDGQTYDDYCSRVRRWL